MKAFYAFTQKELMESWRTRRFIVLLVAFLLIGLLNPLTALLMPQILSNLDMGEIVINLPEPTAMDSWVQFFSNMNQMGMVVLAIVFSGIMAQEFSKGTLINLLTKGLSKRTVILSKFTSASLIWTLAYLVCLGVTAGYTWFFWDLDIQHGFVAFATMWLFGELMIALLIFGGTLFSNFYGSLGLTAVVMMLLSLLNFIPHVENYNPNFLSGTNNLQLLSGGREMSDFLIPSIVTVVAIIVLLMMSEIIFNKKKI